MVKRSFVLFFCTMLVCGCSSIKKQYLSNSLFTSNHSGFYLLDPEGDKLLVNINGEKYFTPASNTKIFTLYAAMNALGDSLPGMEFVMRSDSLIFWGTGDPSFLNPYLPQSAVFDFLKNRSETLYFSSDNFYDNHLGPGWAWDDYTYSYSPEKAPFPVYGNLITFHKGQDTSKLFLTPKYFDKFVYTAYSDKGNGSLYREVDEALVHYSPYPDSVSFTREIPLKWSRDRLVDILSDTLGKKVHPIDYKKPPNTRQFFSIAADSAYREMMQVSDNFIAEQLLLMVAHQITDSLNSSLAIEYMKDSLLSDLPQEPIWVDGSGLSRYNLFTPASLVTLLEKIYDSTNEDRLFNIFAEGGVSGTIKNWYGGEPSYVYAKTGTLSNNHCLSGYIRTRKGRILIFSFMNNNYMGSSTPFKVEMEKILESIYEKY